MKQEAKIIIMVSQTKNDKELGVFQLELFRPILLQIEIE